MKEALLSELIFARRGKPESAGDPNAFYHDAPGREETDETITNSNQSNSIDVCSFSPKHLPPCAKRGSADAASQARLDSQTNRL